MPCFFAKYSGEYKSISLGFLETFFFAFFGFCVFCGVFCLFDDFSLKLQPYLLIQRLIKGNTNSFHDSGSSIFSDKKKIDAKLSDYFALDIKFNGKVKELI